MLDTLPDGVRLDPAERLAQAYDDYRLKRSTNVERCRLQFEQGGIAGATVARADLLANNTLQYYHEAVEAWQHLLQCCNEVASGNSERSAIDRFYALVRNVDSTDEAWTRVLDAFPAAYAAAKSGRVACEQQAEPSNGDGAAPVVEKSKAKLSSPTKSTGRPPKYPPKDKARLQNMWKEYRASTGKNKTYFVRECIDDIPKVFKPQDDKGFDIDELLRVVEQTVRDALEAKRKEEGRKK